MQASLDSLLFDKKYQELLMNRTMRVEKATKLSIASEHGSDRLNEIPVLALGLKLDDSSVRLVCGLMLGMPICEPYICTCRAQVDKHGRHWLRKASKNLCKT